jgi:hypothetical protein
MAVTGWYALYRDGPGHRVRATDGFAAAIGAAWQLHRDGWDVDSRRTAEPTARRRGNRRERDQTHLCADGRAHPPREASSVVSWSPGPAAAWHKVEVGTGYVPGGAGFGRCH